MFGCGPVGQFAIASAMVMGSGRVLAVDCVTDRVDMARAQGAETINFDQENPIDAIKYLTGGIGADRAIDAVGVDAGIHTRVPASRGCPNGRSSPLNSRPLRRTLTPRGHSGSPANAPSQVLSWAVQSLAKAGTLAITLTRHSISGSPAG